MGDEVAASQVVDERLVERGAVEDEVAEILGEKLLQGVGLVVRIARQNPAKHGPRMRISDRVVIDLEDQGDRLREGSPGDVIIQAHLVAEASPLTRLASRSDTSSFVLTRLAQHRRWAGLRSFARLPL